MKVSLLLVKQCSGESYPSLAYLERFERSVLLAQLGNHPSCMKLREIESPYLMRLEKQFLPILNGG